MAGEPCLEAGKFDFCNESGFKGWAKIFVFKDFLRRCSELALCFPSRKMLSDNSTSSFFVLSEALIPPLAATKLTNARSQTRVFVCLAWLNFRLVFSVLFVLQIRDSNPVASLSREQAFRTARTGPPSMLCLCFSRGDENSNLKAVKFPSLI